MVMYVRVETSRIFKPLFSLPGLSGVTLQSTSLVRVAQ